MVVSRKLHLVLVDVQPGHILGGALLVTSGSLILDASVFSENEVRECAGTVRMRGGTPQYSSSDTFGDLVGGAGEAPCLLYPVLDLAICR